MLPLPGIRSTCSKQATVSGLSPPYNIWPLPTLLFICVGLDWIHRIQIPLSRKKKRHISYLTESQNNPKMDSSPACYRHVRTLLLLSVGVLSALAPTASASTCECITINSWTTLRSVVQAALSIGALGTRPHILLCPFSITKTDEESPLELAQQIFLQCMKERDGDECTVREFGTGGVVDGDDLRPMVSIGADNVWVQGLTLTGARGGAVDIAERIKGGKLIDMAFIGYVFPQLAPCEFEYLCRPFSRFVVVVVVVVVLSLKSFDILHFIFAATQVPTTRRDPSSTPGGDRSPTSSTPSSRTTSGRRCKIAAP